MVFKVGQQVRISQKINEDWGSPSVTEDMMDMRGDVFAVKKHVEPEGWYDLGNGYVWSEDMLEPVIITKDEAFQSYLKGFLSDAEYEELIKVIK